MLSTMRRSRSPRRGLATCPICLETLPLTPGADGRRSTGDGWRCAGCSVVCHWHCILPTRTAGHSGLRCPVCRRDRSAIVTELTAPIEATCGHICYACRLDIPSGQLMIRCAMPMQHCVATYHYPQCMPGARGCLACGNTISQAIAARQSR